MIKTWGFQEIFQTKFELCFKTIKWPVVTSKDLNYFETKIVRDAVQMQLIY